METDTFNLDEVVVTGQGNAIQRRRLSSKVTKVSAEDMQKMPAVRIDQMLQDALPNVQISLTNGQPGTTSLIKSRGLSSAFSNSTPVIYIDGVRVDNKNTGSTLAYSLNGYAAEPYSTADLPMGETAASGSISDIPLENIDHIEYVTGGAATTLYGSDAANGVIQIFTKKGREGRFRAAFTTQMGLDIATSQFYHFRRTKDLLNQTGFQQRYRFGFDGGNEKFGYSLGTSMSSSSGIIIHDGNLNKKYDLRFGSRLQINRMLEYQNSYGLVIENFKRSRNGNQGLYTGLWTTECAAIADLRYKDMDGNLKNFAPDIDAAGDYELARMKALIDRAEALQDNEESVKRFQTAQTFLFTPFKHLTFKGTLGIDYRTSSNKEIITNEYLIHTQVKPEGTSNAGRVFNHDRSFFGLTVDVNGQHKFYHNDWLSNIATAGFQYFNTHDHQVSYNGTNVRDGARVMSGAGTITANEWLSYLNSYGFYAQDNIGFLNRYYIDLGMRVDYNTAFGDNVGWQFYPKVGLSYMMSEEPFMKSLSQKGIVNSLRLLANYGVAGNYPPAFEYQKTVNVTSFNGKQAATFGKYGNPNLGPEKKHSYEAGLDASFFHNILTLGLTYYYARTKDAIFSVPTLPSSGQASNYLSNVGDIENKGMEISLGVMPVNTKDWTFNMHASVNTNRNKVLSTGGVVPFRIGGFSSRTIETTVQEGMPVGFLRGAKAILNEDGTLKEVLQLQDLGSTIPTLYGNFSLNLRHKALNFYASGDYQTGSYVHSFDRQFRFRKGLKDAEIPEKAIEGKQQGKIWLDFTNFFVDKADFLKIRNIGIDYTFKLRHCPVRSVNVGMNVYNPFAFTASVVDPEATLSGALSQGAVATSGINYATYSSPRQYVMTVRFDF
ncbi:MAG: TonB-dependent receptor [Prevotellaceae bacterium]|nr:TonB-dependent receptor [Prevotella sp.]MDD7257488.1 TonB-dependent receptor [Prevotellaceae bacterium]MDY6131627.1 TonB-dependent receptor [Prevotella sp.]